MAYSTHQAPGLAYRTAGWAAGCLVLLVHLVVAPALPGCHCRHRADTLCPHEDSAPQPEPPSAVEGAHCHVVPEAAAQTATQTATTQTATLDGAAEVVRQEAPAGSHRDAGAIVAHCDDGQSTPKSYRVGEPYWPVAEVLVARHFVIENVTSHVFERSTSTSRLLDPPLAPPPRLLAVA